LAGKLKFPSHFDPTAKDLVKKLLTADRTKRLGNLKGGADDLKKHKWFRGVDWQGLLNKTVPVSLLTFSCIPLAADPLTFLRFHRHRLFHLISILVIRPILKNMLMLNLVTAKPAT
jgi:hypothetical protein